MGHLTHDEFFSKLTDLFTTTKTKAHGAVYLTQKRLTYPQQPTSTTSPSSSSSSSSTAPPSSSAASLSINTFPDLHPPEPLPLLIRATNGKSKPRRASKVKLSTVVQPAELDAFYARYAEACKAGMSALKPRDRTKRKAKARKRKGGGGTASAAAQA